MRIRSLSHLALITLALTGSTMGASCNGRKPTPSNANNAQRDAAAVAVREGPPSVRLYFLVDLDGYFEPCGCNSRPLGGIDRLAHFIERERANAPNHLLVAVGNLIFRDPTMEERMVYQETRKAESLVQILDRIGLVAFAPGPSDYARGASEYARITERQRAVRLGANVSTAPAADASLSADAGASPAPYRPSIVREIDGVKVAIVGVSDFRPSSDVPAPSGAPSTTDPVESARAAVEAARREGAKVVVVLASVPRRDAVSIARNVRGVDFVVVAREESNTPPPPERVGGAYVLSAPNQGKFVGVVDLYLRDGQSGFTDASPSSADAQRASLDRRIRELRERLESWARDPSVDQSAVAQQRARLAQLERERAAADAPPAPPASGNYFRARAVEIAPELPRSHDIEQQIAAYFRAINEHNRDEYASIAPRPAPRGQASYVGDEECRSCHEPAFAIWERTPHSRAYWTLEVVNKNFNLSCVGCHVTGYQQPGGSEVVQNQNLRNVQCETCHGPGSRHLTARGASNLRATIIRNPPQAMCAQQCHTPEHSDHFNYEQYLPRILGPGHGYPEEAADAGGVRLSAPVIANGQNSDASVIAH
jgi:hypothetical protein